MRVLSTDGAPRRGGYLWKRERVIARLGSGRRRLDPGSVGSLWGSDGLTTVRSR
jgi:hypothetical protein